MKKWLIHQPPEEAAKQIRSGSDLSMLCAQVLASRGMHNVQEAAAFLQCDGLADPFLTADMETAADYIKIPAYGEKMLVCYIYPSYAWLPEMTDSPYTIGCATLAKGTYPQKAFITEGALNSIARNTQVNIRATLSVDARLILKYEVVDWGMKEITVPPFN